VNWARADRGRRALLKIENPNGDRTHEPERTRRPAVGEKSQQENLQWRKQIAGPDQKLLTIKRGQNCSDLGHHWGGTNSKRCKIQFFFIEINTTEVNVLPPLFDDCNINLSSWLTIYKLGNENENVRNDKELHRL
jgi:hypothetical protein